MSIAGTPEQPANPPPSDGSGAPPSRKPSRWRKWLFRFLALALSLVVSLVVLEVFFRIREANELAQTFREGEGGKWIPDTRWGWKPSQGWFREANPEFDMTGTINSLFMNDVPFDPQADAGATRILALGDSHTLAVGVSQDETWVKRLESRLGSKSPGKRLRTYNAGCSGYSVHQYLLRLIDQGPEIKPHFVVVGFSYATDLYDLLPPDHGGWIYGGTMERDYFDLAKDGNLVEKHYAPAAAANESTEGKRAAFTVREFLDNFATFRQLRRSNLALWVGSNIRVGGQSLWPNMEVVVEKEVSPEHAYQWQLLQAILSRTKEECKKQGATLIIVGIPYLPQVYDEIWAITYGKDPARYERDAASRRLAAWCRSNEIAFVETTDALREKVKEVGHWVHYRKDAHPTPEGHEVIADAIVQSNLIHAN